ncbi:MAG: hypothetical protein Q4D16_10450 [Eubacteriales bacterium]|nr:hypothetical protein [Eubacteriales bacterium]
MMRKTANKMVNKWKRILAVMLTLAMLTQNCYSIMAAAMDETPGSSDTMLLQDEGDPGNDGGDMGDAGDGGNSGGDQGDAGVGNDIGSGGDESGSGNGTDSGDGSGEEGSGDSGNVDGGNSGSNDAGGGNDGTDGSGSDEGTGDGGSDNGNINDGNADSDSEGNGSEGEEEPAPEITSSAAMDVPGSAYIEKIEYSYTAPEGENPWSNILSVSSVSDDEKPSDLNEVFSKRNQSVVNSEFFKVTSSEEKENIPALAASLR